MKKMKGLVAMESPSYTAYPDLRTRFRHQSLLQDYEELKKETEAMRRKLLTMKGKKLVLSGEVSFLRRRFKCLTRYRFSLPERKPGVAESGELEIRQPPTIPKSINYKRKKAIVQERNRKGRTSNGVGVDTSLQKPQKEYDLNQNAKNFDRIDSPFRNTTPSFDLNQNEGIYIAKEATKKNVTPVFDLNEISREEDEEVQVGCEVLNLEEPKRNIIQRNEMDDQHNEMMISVCRTGGGGSDRTGKRKFSWQDQVALSVRGWMNGISS